MMDFDFDMNFSPSFADAYFLTREANQWYQDPASNPSSATASDVSESV